jgi:arabinose-5-phosphate isomerase
MVTREDVVIAMSNSGESAELVTIVPVIKRQGARLIAITGEANSTLAREADVHLDAKVAQEACPLGLAPTASTAAAMALGDALAIALLDARGFSADDFARSHPGGALGRRLLTHVQDVMRTGDEVPSVTQSASFSDALLEMSRKRMGMTAVVDAEQRVLGIFTDGDLRRSLDKLSDIRTLGVAEVMTRAPRTITADKLAVEAVEIMERHKVNQILVVSASGQLVGALNMHDLFKARVI